jgi:hypothetical protein
VADLLRFAGVLGAKTTSRMYTVKRGDTLTKIAQKPPPTKARPSRPSRPS